MLILVVCDHMRIQVEKQPPTIKTILFEQGEAPPPEVGPDAYARTHWQFNCQLEADYKIIEKHETSSGWFVELRLTAVKLKLTMPIVIYLPENASDRVKLHEQGHVEICKRIYAQAPTLAGLEARGIMKTFQGHGVRVEEACEDAIRVANLQLVEAYGNRTLEVVNCVSTIYDFLETSRTADSEKSVDEAFHNFSAGGPRRL